MARKATQSRPDESSKAVMLIGSFSSARDLLQSKEGEIKRFLAGALTADRLINTVLSQISRNPDLLSCTRGSLLLEIFHLAQLDLDATPALGQVYLVPFWNSKIGALEAKMMLGYRGLANLARRSKEVLDIQAHLVYQQEIDQGRFGLDYGSDDPITHTPILSAQRGPIAGAYMLATLANGLKRAEYMNIEELLAIKERTKSRNKKGEIVGPWATDESEMFRKVPIRRGTKHLPASIDLGKGLEFDRDTVEIGDSSAFDVEVIALPEPTKADRAENLAKRLKSGGKGVEKVHPAPVGEEAAPVDESVPETTSEEPTPPSKEPTPEVKEPAPKEQTTGEQVGQSIREGGAASSETLFDRPPSDSDESLRMDQETAKREAGK